MSIHIIFTLLLPMRDWRWLKRGLIKVWHFHHSKLCYVNCEIGLCLLRDKMEHSIVIVCPFYLKRVGNRAAFLEHFKSILGIELHFESILKHF